MVLGGDLPRMVGRLTRPSPGPVHGLRREPRGRLVAALLSEQVYPRRSANRNVRIGRRSTLRRRLSPRPRRGRPRAEYEHLGWSVGAMSSQTCGAFAHPTEHQSENLQERRSVSEANKTLMGPTRSSTGSSPQRLEVETRTQWAEPQPSRELDRRNTRRSSLPSVTSTTSDLRVLVDYWVRNLARFGSSQSASTFEVQPITQTRVDRAIADDLVGDVDAVARLRVPRLGPHPLVCPPTTSSRKDGACRGALWV